MDSIWSPTSLSLFLVFFIPGFISQKVYGLFVPDDERESSTVVINAIAYSCVTFAVTSPLIWLLWSGWQHPSLPFAISALLIILIVIPVSLPILWLRLRNTPFISARLISPIKRPWDFALTRSGGYWVIITFKNGSKIAGTYRNRSFSSTYPHPEQIYLEKIWNLSEDGLFTTEVPDSKGAIIMGEEILTVELFALREVNHG